MPISLSPFVPHWRKRGPRESEGEEVLAALLLQSHLQDMFRLFVFVCLFLVQCKHLRGQFSSDLERGDGSSPSPLFTSMLGLWPQWDLVNSTASKKWHYLALNDPLASPKTPPCSSQECPQIPSSCLCHLFPREQMPSS